ncbi:MAG: phosphatase PAP2 family protein [Acidimicrobiales bacterium]
MSGHRQAAARTRMLLGLAGLVVSALPLRRHQVGPREARAFRAVNGLPDRLYTPIWVVMQGGALGAAFLAAAIAWWKGRYRLAIRLFAAGSLTWALSKAVKRVARRGRPAALLGDVRHRGKPASGMGYLSGHAGVAVALASTALPVVGRRSRLALVAAVPLVGLSRLYVGAHLPLDIAGGAALGLAVDGALTFYEWRADR